MTTIGQQIIGEIVKQGMVQIAHPDPAESHVLVWKENAADQLDALVLNNDAMAWTYRKSWLEALDKHDQLKKEAETEISKLKAALDQTLCCSNGHYNPLFKCDCYQKAHDLVSNESSSVTCAGRKGEA